MPKGLCTVLRQCPNWGIWNLLNTCINIVFYIVDGAGEALIKSLDSPCLTVYALSNLTPKGASLPRIWRTCLWHKLSPYSSADTLWCNHGVSSCINLTLKKILIYHTMWNVYALVNWFVSFIGRPLSHLTFNLYAWFLTIWISNLY